MATDYWASSHYKRWTVDRGTLQQARVEDLRYVEDPEYLDLLAMYFANIISRLGRKLQLRQRVIATATVFFRRFYLKNAYCETEPFIVIAACCYVAAKVEELPVHIKTVVSEAKSVFTREYHIKHFPADNTKLAEMEFYLVDDLECDLIVFHPYRTLLALCRKESTPHDTYETEAGEVGTGIGMDDGPRYWGTGAGQLELHETAFQTAWFIINDTYRSDICLMYPPHLIAITAIYLTLVIHAPTLQNILPFISSDPTSSEEHAMRRSSRPSSSAYSRPLPQDPVAFLADLNVSMSLIATIAQEILSLYCLWDRYKEDNVVELAAKGARDIVQTPKSSRSGSSPGEGEMGIVTPAFLSHLTVRMREARLADVTQASSGRPVAVNKRLERTQAAG